MKSLNRWMFPLAWSTGLVAVAWVAVGFVGSSASALAMSVAIAVAYLLGAAELRRDRTHTARLCAALAQPPDAAGGDAALGTWLDQLPDPWREPVRQRLQGQRLVLPGPAYAPYLVGLLVMLGMLGTFVGMLMTFKGAVFALEGSADLAAIRSALAAPIKGLGLAFGTSVAGVATSAMLGLMSAIARRERSAAARLLERAVATALRPWSAAEREQQRQQQRQQAFEQQAQALPALVQQMQSWMDGMAQRHQMLDEGLRTQQQQFHAAAQQAYTQLADEVSQALRHNLVNSAQAAAEGLRPVWQAGVSELVQTTRDAHQQLLGATQAQIDQWGQQWQGQTERLAQGWAQLVEQHTRQMAQAQAQQASAATELQQQWDTRSGAWLGALADWSAQQQQAQQARQQQHDQQWHDTLHSWAQAQQERATDAAAQAQAQQQALLAQLAQVSDHITAQAQAQAQHSQLAWSDWLAQTQASHAARLQADAEALAEQRQRFDALAQLWRQELQALRDDEASHAQAAVARLGELQAALAQQLGTLGAALEAPLTRLLHTAAEVPQSAAAVITEMRQEMARLNERDNHATEQQQALAERLASAVLQLERSAQAQAEAIARLVQSAADTLAQAGQRVDAQLQAQAQASADTGAHLHASAIELASLAEAFQQGVMAFGSSNDKLVEGLLRVETGLRQAMTRSDEQMAYYVAQAREVIDLSLSAQQSLLQDLRPRQPEGQPA